MVVNKIIDCKVMITTHFGVLKKIEIKFYIKLTRKVFEVGVVEHS